MNSAFFGTDPVPVWDLIVTRSELAEDRRRRPGVNRPLIWPPEPDKWETAGLPLDDSEAAIRQWFDFVTFRRGPVRCVDILRQQERQQGRRQTDPSAFVRDGWRLVLHLAAEGRRQDPGDKPTGSFTPLEAVVELKRLRDWPFQPEAALDDEFTQLRAFARDQLKGQELAVIEALCASKGELPIADLGVKPGVDWADPKQGFRNAQSRLRPKLKKQGWSLTRQNNAAKLKPIRS
jgi:hypothetical protein